MEPGQYLDTWGSRMNAQFGSDLLDASLDGVEGFALSGSKTLTNNNGAADEARKRVLNVTGGTGGTITIPNVAKTYLVRNASSGDVVITTGSGTTATVVSGVTKWVFSTGSNVVYADSGPDFGAANVVTTGSGTFGSLSTAGTLASGAQTVTGTVNASSTIATFNGAIVASYAGASAGTGNFASIQSGGVISCLTSAGYPTGASVTLTLRAGGYEFYAGTGGAMPFSLTSSEVRTHVGTTGSAGNAFIDNANSNRLLRSTSSEWYKTGIEDVEQKYLDAALSIRAVYYRPHPEHAPNDNPDHSYWGHIAEEVAAIDPRLVHWGYQDRDYEDYETEIAVEVPTDETDEAGNPIFETVMRTVTKQRLKEGAQLRPDGAQYERINVLKIEALKRKVEALEARLAKLEAA